MTKLSFECTENWDAMTPVEGGRHCATCDKTVVDVRGKTRREFNAMRMASNGKLCIRAHAHPETRELMFAPGKKRLPLIANAALAIALAACTSDATSAPTPAPATNHLGGAQLELDPPQQPQPVVTPPREPVTLVGEPPMPPTPAPPTKVRHGKRTPRPATTPRPTTTPLLPPTQHEIQGGI